MKHRRPYVQLCLMAAVLAGMLAGPVAPCAREGAVGAADKATNATTSPDRDKGPLTVAEESGFKATSKHADVMRFIHDLQKLSPLLRVETMATTAEGKTIPLMIIGDPVPTCPADLEGDDRAVVYIQANIHAGEVEGKESAQMLARDILLSERPDYLDKLVILIAPNFNPDGNDKISTENRTRQHGPEGGVGVRHNGQNLDLNRDALKLETPEVRGFVENVLTRWDPIFCLDSHTHNGSYHQEPVTWAWALNPNGDAAIISYMEEVVLPSITAIMKDKYNTLSVPHGDFLDVKNPEKGWVAHGTICRYLVNYVGLRNRFSVLHEEYPYVDFETRVRTTYSLFRAFLDFIYEHKDEMGGLARDADRKAIARGERPEPGGEFIVEYDREALDTPLTILGWEMEVEEREGTWPRVTRTDREKVYENVPYYARHTAKRTVQYPRGYLIRVHNSAVEENLIGHGITVERLAEPARLDVEVFTVTEIAGSERLNQGHYTSTAKGEYSTAEMDFPAGTLYVSTAQRLGPLAAFLLEAESGDGLLFWNFFDRYLAPQWGNRPQQYPVYRVLQPAELVTVN
jgi:hypothetical protein